MEGLIVRLEDYLLSCVRTYYLPSWKSVAKFLLICLVVSVAVVVVDGCDADDIGRIHRWARSLATRLDAILLEIMDIVQVIQVSLGFMIL